MKITLLAGLMTTAAVLIFPTTGEARSCGSRSGISISFSSGSSHFHHGSHVHKSYHRYASPFRYSRYRYYCPPIIRRSVSHYRPVKRYVSAPAYKASVADVQYVLKRRGYNVGTVDGIWGGKTERALKRFQRDVGLRPCGTLTPATLRALGL